MNAVEVNNIDTLEEQDYYIDMYGPDMSFSLYTDGILDADIWVNEIDHFTENEMRIMLKEQPTTTRADYNLKGGIEAFYIKWEEVEHFEYSLAGGRIIEGNSLNFGKTGDYITHIIVPFT